MTVNPDQVILFRAGFVTINATIFYTWIVMAILVLTSFLITRKLSIGPNISRRQHFLEAVVEILSGQLKNITGRETTRYFPYLGTLFLFIFCANVMELIPFVHSPTASFSTTAALAFTVFIAVPLFGILENGFFEHLKYYLEPVIVMLPLNIITEFTRVIAMSIRLFGNIMSESLVGAILLLILPLFVPVLMDILGLIICTVQAYIFFILAAVFIGGAVAARAEREHKDSSAKESLK